MATLSPWLDQKFYLADGVTPNAGGKVFTYEPGTTTKKTTYVSESGAANANPIVLNSSGECNLWLGAGGYKIVNAPANDTDPPAAAIKTWDDINVSGDDGGGHGIVGSVAELKGLDEGTFSTVEVIGYNGYGTPGGGLFYWDSSSTASDNGGTIIAPTVSDGTGRWLRRLENQNEVRVSEFGAGDISASIDTDALVAAYGSFGSDDGTIIIDVEANLSAPVTIPANVTIKDGGGLFDLDDYNLTINGPFDWGLRQAFSYTGTGVVTFSTGCSLVCSPEHWGGVPDAYSTSTENTAAVQACMTAAATGSREVYLSGWYRCEGTITIPQRSMIIRGASADASGIAHDPATFINCFEGDTLGEGWIRMHNFSLEAFEYGLGKTKYMLYFDSLNEGSKIDIKINGGVGQIYVGSGYLSDINIRCSNSTWDAVGDTTVTQSEWEEVWGDNHAPIHLNSMNACNLCIRTFRVCTVVTGGITGFAPILIDDSVGFESTAMNIEWGLTNYDTFTNGLGTFAPRTKHAMFIESCVGNFHGLNFETMRTTESLIKVTRESALHISGVNDYYTYCEGDRFLSLAHNDQVIEVYRGYVMRNGSGNLFKTTNSGISASQGWIVRAAMVSYGSRYRQTIANSGPNDDAENIIDTCEFSGVEKLGISEDSARTYNLDRITIPKVLTGYAVTSGSSPTYSPTVAAAAGAYVEITCGVFMRENGQHVSLKWYTGSATGSLQRFRLRPITASKWYRVFVGIGGNPYLIEYGSDPAATPEGNWIAGFATDGALAITGLATNPRIPYVGIYTPNDTDVQVVASAVPSTGYWRAGSTWKYGSGTSLVGGKCITAGTPGTWRNNASAALTVGSSTVGNVGVGEDDLMSWTMPADTLLANDDSVSIEMAGQFAATANNKRLRIYCASTVIFDTTSMAISAASDWSINILILRTGSATQRVRVDFSSTNSVLTTSMKYTACTETMSGAITIKATAEATANNDITQTLMIAMPVIPGA